MTDIAFPYRFDGGGRTAQPASTTRQASRPRIVISPGRVG